MPWLHVFGGCRGADPCHAAEVVRPFEAMMKDFAQRNASFAHTALGPGLIIRPSFEGRTIAEKLSLNPRWEML
jgi:hypothetical protein